MKKNIINGKKVVLLFIIVLAIVILAYLVLIIRLEIKYASKADYNSEVGAFVKQDGDYYVYVNPWFAYKNYALVDKTFYYEKYECDATVSVIVKETIFGNRTMVFTVHADTLKGSVSGQFDADLNYTMSTSKVIPLGDSELGKIEDCKEEIYSVMNEANKLWNLGLNIPKE